MNDLTIHVFFVDMKKKRSNNPKISTENFKYIHNFMRNRIYTYDILMLVIETCQRACRIINYR